MGVFEKLQCVHCGYSLRGLPVDRACPECGFTRDEHTYIMKARGPWEISFLGLISLSFSVLFLISIAEIPLTFLAILVGERAAGILALVLLLGAVIWCLRVIVRLWTVKRYAAVTPGGLRARSLFAEIVVPWTEFRYFQMYGFVPTLFREGSQAYRIYLVGIFPNRRSFTEFDEEVEKGLVRYRARK